MALLRGGTGNEERGTAGEEPGAGHTDRRAMDLLKGVKIACIGPITSETARDLGLRVEVEAKEYTIPGLVEALEEFYAKERR
jgi:uroporphyrinogen-III synthase